MSKIEIDASKARLRLSAEGAVAMIIGCTLALVILAAAFRYLA
ncbi:hypothetical protein [Mesorhizobium sp. BR1-1-16]|nr:hypothetical protein [Mesorhizobium sp. BR1-1-16]